MLTLDHTFVVWSSLESSRNVQVAVNMARQAWNLPGGWHGYMTRQAWNLPGGSHGHSARQALIVFDAGFKQRQ